MAAYCRSVLTVAVSVPTRNVMLCARAVVCCDWGVGTQYFSQLGFGLWTLGFSSVGRFGLRVVYAFVRMGEFRRLAVVDAAQLRLPKYLAFFAV